MWCIFGICHDADADGVMLALDEVRAASWSSRKTIVPTGTESTLAAALQPEASRPQAYEMEPLFYSVFGQGNKFWAKPTAARNQSQLQIEVILLELDGLTFTIILAEQSP
jgi:hypothetical protein